MIRLQHHIKSFNDIITKPINTIFLCLRATSYGEANCGHAFVVKIKCIKDFDEHSSLNTLTQI